MRITILILGLLWTVISFGQPKLESFHVKCEEHFDDSKYQYLDRIKEIAWISDTLIIKIAKIDNCAFQGSKGFQKTKGDTLFLNFQQEAKYKESQDNEEMIFSLSLCDCPLEFSYKITGLVEKEYTIFLNDSLIKPNNSRFKTFPITYDLVDDDTINYIDKYGLAQGFWIESEMIEGEHSDSVRWVNGEINYLDGDLKNGKIYRLRPDSSISVISTFITADSVKVDFFDKNGALYKVEFYENGDKYETVTYPLN